MRQGLREDEGSLRLGSRNMHVHCDVPVFHTYDHNCKNIQFCGSTTKRSIETLCSDIQREGTIWKGGVRVRFAGLARPAYS